MRDLTTAATITEEHNALARCRVLWRELHLRLVPTNPDGSQRR